MSNRTKIAEPMKEQIKKSERETPTGKGEVLAQDNYQQPDTLWEEDINNSPINKSMQDNSSYQEEANWIHVKRSGMSGGKMRSPAFLVTPMRPEKRREELAESSPDTIKKMERVSPKTTPLQQERREELASSIDTIKIMERAFPKDKGEVRLPAALIAPLQPERREEFAVSSPDTIKGKGEVRSSASLIVPLQQEKKEELPVFSMDILKQSKKMEIETLTDKGAAPLQDNDQQSNSMLKEDTNNPPVNKCMQDQEELNWIPVKQNSRRGARPRSSDSVVQQKSDQREELATLSLDTLKQIKKNERETKTAKGEGLAASAQIKNQQSDTLLKEDINNSPATKGHEQQGSQSPTPSEVLRTPANKAEHSTLIGQADHDINMLTPDDINFPKLHTPTSGTRTLPAQHNTEPDSKSKDSQFVWKPQHVANLISKSHTAHGGKGKDKLLESTPLTRQGYRSGRLAEDFWTAIGVPNTPATNSKMLRVIPFLTKNRQTSQAEYLVDKRCKPFGPIAYVHIAEVLAGIPWTSSRAKLHVVNEVSLAMHKILIFNNNFSNPFQRWNQGQWYAQWTYGTEGESVCTLYVSIDVLEQKVKPRKGNNMGWRKEPMEVSTIRASQLIEDIHLIEAEQTLWQSMAGLLPTLKATDQAPPESHNRFATLLEDEVVSA